jgi:hypothetical protein
LLQKAEEAKQNAPNGCNGDSIPGSSEGIGSSDNEQINKEALMAYYNTTGLPDTVHVNTLSPGIPISQDLVGLQTSGESKVTKTTQEAQT